MNEEMPNFPKVEKTTPTSVDSSDDERFYSKVLHVLTFATFQHHMLSKRFDDRGLPWELLYADDLVLLADSEEDLKRKLQRWKSGLEAKGLRVNVGKTKVMKCGVGLQKVVDSRKYPCGVCGKGVDANSIKCTLMHEMGTQAL